MKCQICNKNEYKWRIRQDVYYCDDEKCVQEADRIDEYLGNEARKAEIADEQEEEYYE